MDRAFVIHKQLGITLRDLGRQGCIAYVFNRKAAQDHVQELLDMVDLTGPSGAHIFDQDQAGAWLTSELSHIGDQPLSKPKTPLEISACQPVLHKQMMSWLESLLYPKPCA